MSQIVSWLGNAEYGVSGLRFRETNSVVFRPTDISGLQMWLDANDGFAVNANEFGTVLSWENKGDLSGVFDLSGTADVRYGDNFINGLNVVTFNADAYMLGSYAMNFQDRSMFFVSRRNQDISGGTFTWLTSDTAGGLESGISESSGVYSYLIAKHPGFSVQLDFDTTTNTTGYAELATFINSSTDISNNYVALNGTSQSIVVNNLASGYNTSLINYYLGNYFGGSTLPNDYDLCELIIYDNVLTTDQRATVEGYLIKKWAITNPPTPSYNLIGEWDFNNYVGSSSVIPNSIVGAADATINEYSSCTFDNSTSGNYSLLIYAPNNFPANTAGITLPSLANVSAIEVWVNYVDDGLLNYSQYFIDARTGATNGYWITEGYSSTDQIGNYFTNATIYFNGTSQVVDVSAGQPLIGPTLLNHGWKQVVIVPETPISDDIALFMRNTGIQGMPVSVADICVYENPITQADIISIFNSKCSRYGLSPI
jgi:hypothetical protein